ncbi:MULTISPECIES: B12-binding domain-containing protein [Bacillaceae]|uniref:cobalamin B12-binding domain-containing protein n=1 Tax=Bacillaceae TaxID=186817 RepID=UPI000E71B781|nr:B12-binding domain-containing protein [Bacillus sp. PK3_68]RJS61266.1 cobalamin-binding protein [Bacillus sp. PK3_68]
MSEEAREFAEYLLEGDALASIDFIKHRKQLTTLELFNQLVTPAMRHVGELWENNKITVADEHLATGTCDFVLSRLFPWQKEQPSVNKKAMFLCPQGERHYLGLKMVSSLFVESGWSVRFFGSDLPLESALTTAHKWQPDVIGLSVAIVYHLPHLQDYIERFSDLPSRPAIILGGRLAGMYDLKPYCSESTIIFEDLQAAHLWLKNNRIEGESNVSL